MLYYVVELYEKTIDISHMILVNEEVLENFVVNYDKDIYKLINISGVGKVEIDYKNYLKKEEGLEIGKQS